MSAASLLHDTEQFLHEQIPLTRAMGVQVETYDEEQLILTAPLAPNHNHLGTAFGGSLSAIATLTGYCMLWLLLGHRESHIVIRNSSINYRRPVRRAIRATCLRPDETAFSTFKAKFEQTGKAQMTLQVTIVEDDLACVEFEGVFVAIR